MARNRHPAPPRAQVEDAVPQEPENPVLCGCAVGCSCLYLLVLTVLAAFGAIALIDRLS